MKMNMCFIYKSYAMTSYSRLVYWSHVLHKKCCTCNPDYYPVIVSVFYSLPVLKILGLGDNFSFLTIKKILKGNC